VQPLPAPTAVVADDERLMREQLIARLKDAWPELVIVGEASNGREAIAIVQSLEPDIVFLDISMPGVDGIEAARTLAGRAHVVFVTAHDQYAIGAFEQGAVDYLLKPAEPERVALIRKPIKELIAELDPDEFWQIHRATVVRVDAVEQVSRNLRGNQVVHVKGSEERLEVSRSYNHVFKQM
jgi:DNA-binding LytR/AlgR family response regulator